MSKIIYRVDLQSFKGNIPAKYFDTEQEARAYGDSHKNWSGRDYKVMKWRTA